MAAKSFPHGRSATDRRPWYERQPKSLETARRIAADHPSSLTLRIDGDKQLVVLEGKLRFAPAHSGSASEFVTVEVFLSPYHPEEEPQARDTDARFPSSPPFHKFKDDWLCLWLPGESEWTRDDEALRPYLDQLVVHVHRQLVCEADPRHQWPGEERAHTAAGAYTQVLMEALGSFELAECFVGRWRKSDSTSRNGFCLCNSGKKWKRCHREAIEDFERRCGVVRLREAYRQKIERPKEAV